MADVAVSFHPLAGMFPLLEGDDYTALLEDILANGQREPIVLLRGQVLDGRNRYRACMDLGLTPQCRDLDAGEDPQRWVLSANLHRRHLTASQRAMVTAKLVTTSGKGRPINGEHSPFTQADAAAAASVDRKTLAAAATVHRDGIEELVRRVEDGSLPVDVAARAAKLPAALQQEVARADTDRASTVVKQVLRANREREMSEASDTAAAQLATARRYNVILADPPWRFEVWSQRGMDRAADNHYPTTTIDSLSIMDVPAADDCVLFLWATAPMLREALTIMEAWDFEYRTHFVWDKDRAGTGYWNRNKHELLLIGTRGDIPAPAPGTQWNSVVAARWPGEHSAKPVEFHQLVEAYYPTARKLEMFARDRIRPPRDGWDTWGNEAAGLSDTAEVPDNAAVS